MRTSDSILCIALAVAATGAAERSSARADEPRPIAKPGTIEARLGFELALNEDNAKDPVSLSPDLRYGVSDALDVGLIHSTEAVTGFAGFQSGASLCVSGPLLCDPLGVYHNLGVEGRYALDPDRPLWFAGTAAVLANQLDPLRLSLKLGAKLRWTAGRFAVGIESNVQLPVTERATSFDVLTVPVEVAYGIPELRAGIQTGASSSVDELVLDNLRIPLSLRLRSEINRTVAVGVDVSLPAFRGGKAVAQTGFEARTLSAWVAFTTPDITGATDR